MTAYPRTLLGATARTGVLLDWDGDDCALRAVKDPDPDNARNWRYLHYATGNGCAPGACWPSVVCTANNGIVEIIVSTVAPTRDSTVRYLANPDLPWEDFEFFWSSERFRLRLDGEFESLGYEHGISPQTDELPVPQASGVACSSWLRGGESVP